MATQRRAKQGGEYGKNGEWYEGGKFIANTDAPKGKAKKAAKKREIAPCTWEVQPTTDHRAIFSVLGGVYGTYNHDTEKMIATFEDCPQNILDIFETFNSALTVSIILPLIHR